MRFTITYDDIVELKKERKEKWLKENSPKSLLNSSSILSLNPDLGFYIKVENLEISEDFFKEEFDQICKGYFSVIKKLEDYYKSSKENNL